MKLLPWKELLVMWLHGLQKNSPKRSALGQAPSWVEAGVCGGSGTGWVFMTSLVERAPLLPGSTLVSGKHRAAVGWRTWGRKHWS